MEVKTTQMSLLAQTEEQTQPHPRMQLHPLWEAM